MTTMKEVLQNHNEEKKEKILETLKKILGEAAVEKYKQSS